jgi:hypothetical protein
MIAKAQDAKALGTEKTVASCISHLMHRLVMLATIQLNDKAARARNEIDDIGTDRGLTTGPNPVQSMRPNKSPNDTFRIRRFRP